MKWNLKKQIMVPTIGMVIGVATIISIGSFLMGRSLLHDSLKQQLDQLCATSLTQVENWVENQRQFLALWAQYDTTQGAAVQGPGTASSRQSLDDQMQHATAAYEFFENFRLADTNGLTIAASSPDLIGKNDLADTPHFQDARTGKTALSEVYTSPTSGHPLVAIAVPVLTNGTVCGVLCGTLDLNWFSSRFISPFVVLKTGYAYVFDQHGTVIAHADKSKILKVKLPDYDWGRQMLASRSGEIHYTFDGVEKSAIFKTSDQLHWGVALTMPTAELNASVHQLATANLTRSFGALVIGVLLMLAIVRSINRPIQRVVDALETTATQISQAAAQISESSQSLAEGANEQASSLEETGASLEELAAMTRRNSENSKQANQLAQQAHSVATEGAAQMHNMNLAMDAIKTSSNAIAKILKSIDEIAFQTNILALNAAVEAARAGEAGLGFAVVADEVRNLAQRSAQAARETAAKIEAAITSTKQGVTISADVAQHLDRILAEAKQVTQLVGSVASASQEQTLGITQINSAVGQMDKVTQANAASAEQSAAAAQELLSQAALMKNMVDELVYLLEGKDVRNVAAADAPEPGYYHPTRPVHSTPHPKSKTAFPMKKRIEYPKTEDPTSRNGQKSKPERSLSGKF